MNSDVISLILARIPLSTWCRRGRTVLRRIGKLPTQTKERPKQTMPKGKNDDDDEGKEGAASLHGLIHKGEAIQPIGTMIRVPFCVLGNDKSHVHGGTLQRGLHDNSVTDKSIRENGWRYDQGSPMLAIEVAWTQKEWEAEIAAGKYESGTPMPDPLRKRTWVRDAGGLANIVITDKEWRMRRFIMDDGNHRTRSMNNMIKEKHPKAIEWCDRGCLLLDCDPIKDQVECMFSSILANVKQQEVDKDFLADKLGQIKLVNTHTHTHTHTHLSSVYFVLDCVCT